MSEQDYTPGTTIIKNLIGRDDEHPFGTINAERLQLEEEQATGIRMLELRRAPEVSSPRAYTFSYMRQIHQHLFQDVYAWAGEPRRVPMSKRGTKYATPTEMNSLLRQQFTQLAEQNYLRGITDREEFTRKLAATWAEINHGHAFREGNTRSQTVFFTQLAKDAGWELDAARLSPHREHSVYRSFVDARFEHQRLRQVPGLNTESASLDLANVLYSIITPEGSRERTAHPTATPAETKCLQPNDPHWARKILESEGLEIDEQGFINFNAPTPPEAESRPRRSIPSQLKPSTLEQDEELQL